MEVIVVNDGSTDNSRDLVEKYIEEYPDFPLTLINKGNGGVSTARNAGMKKATGDWIALLDSDDKWLSNKLQRQIQILKENVNIDFLATGRNNEVISRIGSKKLENLDRVSAKDLLIKNVFSPPSVIFRRSIIDNIGLFDEEQRYAEEGNYFIRIANKFNCYFLNETLVLTGDGKAHFGESGLSGNIWEMEKGELKNLKDAKKFGIINRTEFAMLNIFSVLKFIRRWIIVKGRKLKNLNDKND